MATIYRCLIDNKLYRMYEVTPRMYATTYYEVEDVIDGGRYVLKEYSKTWRQENFIPVGED